MTINIALILYFLMLLVFFGGVASITYHLVYYRMNQLFATLTTVVFIIGAIVFFLANIAFALRVDWSQFALIF